MHTGTAQMVLPREVDLIGHATLSHYEKGHATIPPPPPSPQFYFSEADCIKRLATIHVLRIVISLRTYFCRAMPEPSCSL